MGNIPLVVHNDFENGFTVEACQDLAVNGNFPWILTQVAHLLYASRPEDRATCLTSSLCVALRFLFWEIAPQRALVGTELLRAGILRPSGCQ